MVAPRRSGKAHDPKQDQDGGESPSARLSPATAWISVGLGVLCAIRTPDRFSWKDRTASRDYFAPEPATGTGPGGHLITPL